MDFRSRVPSRVAGLCRWRAVATWHICPPPSPASHHLAAPREQHPQSESPRRQPLPAPARSPGTRLPLSLRLARLPLRLSHPPGILILRQAGCCLCPAPGRSERSPPPAYLISLPPLLVYCQGNWNQTPARNEINVLKTARTSEWGWGCYSLIIYSTHLVPSLIDSCVFCDDYNIH